MYYFIKRLTLFSILFVMIISPTSQRPSITVEMLDRNGKAICSGFFVSNNSLISEHVMTANHCTGVVSIRTVNNKDVHVIKVYRDIQEDLAIYQIIGGEQYVDNYYQFGFAFQFGIFKIHSHVNHLKCPLFFIYGGSQVITEMGDNKNIFTLVEALVPLQETATDKGHSGSAVTQNNRIVGMVLGHDELIQQSYILPGMQLKYHWKQYQRILEELNNQYLFSSYERNNFYE